ncbi:MAG: hypothetical protein AAB368_07955, partial [bacterium]
ACCMDAHGKQRLASVYDEWKADLLKKGSAAVNEDRLREAVDQWKKVLLIDSHNAEAQKYISDTEPIIEQRVKELMVRGDKAYEEGAIATALDNWQQAAALDPTNTDVQAKLKQVSAGKLAESLRKKASAAYTEGDFPTALARGDEALKINPKDQASKSLRARIVKAQSSGFKSIYDKAVKDLAAGKLLAAKRGFEQARDLEPSNTKVNDNLQKVAKRIDDSIARHTQDGNEAHRSGNKDAAKKAFEAVLALDPTNKDAAAAVKQLTGKESTVVASGEKITELRKKIITAYLSNDMITVEKLSKQALDIQPGNAEMTSYRDRARAKLKRGTSQGA